LCSGPRRIGFLVEEKLHTAEVQFFRLLTICLPPPASCLTSHFDVSRILETWKFPVKNLRSKFKLVNCVSPEWLEPFDQTQDKLIDGLNQPEAMRSGNPESKIANPKFIDSGSVGAQKFHRCKEFAQSRRLLKGALTVAVLSRRRTSTLFFAAIGRSRSRLTITSFSFSQTRITAFLRARPRPRLSFYPLSFSLSPLG
jgi:hypothetical protein